MSAVIYYENRFISLNNFLLSESIKPKVVPYGTNSEFNNSKIFKAGPIIGTSFKYLDRIYTILLQENNELGFYFCLKEDVDFNNFDYFDTIVKETKYELASPSNAAKIFGFIFYLTLEIIKKYNIKVVRFNAAHKKLDYFYETLMENKLFVEEFTKLGFTLSREGKFFVFKAK